MLDIWSHEADNITLLAELTERRAYLIPLII